MSRITARKHACQCVVAGFVLVAMPTGALAQITTQVVEYYHTDALGSVRAVTKQVNGQWQVVARYDYMPFGEETAPQVPPSYKRLFTGKERDQETAQDYFGARYYRAGIGQFTTVDPLHTWKENLEDPQRWNRYTYARNNPLKFTDPDGRAIQWVVAALAAAYVFAAPSTANAPGPRDPILDSTPAIGPPMVATGTVALAEAVLARLGLAGAAATGAGEVIAGPYGEVTRDALERAASSAGSTVEVVTRLTSAPQAGRALSAAGGQGAEALANAARSGGTVFTAQIPSALLTKLQGAGLVEVKTTLMNGVVSTEYRFLPKATEFIVKYFEKQ